MTAPQVEIVPQWQSYVDLNADVKPFLRWPSGASSNDALLQDTIDAACWWVQDFMGRPVAPTQFFRRFNGYANFGGSTVDLPYYPVIVDSSHPITVTEYWGVSGPHTLTLQTPEAQGGSDMFTLDAVRGLIIRSYLGLLQRPTFPGLKNIEVTWWAGFNPIPAHWRRGTLKLIKHWWDCEQQQVAGGGFRRPESGYEPQHSDFLPDVPKYIKEIFGGGMSVGIA